MTTTSLGSEKQRPFLPGPHEDHQLYPDVVAQAHGENTVASQVLRTAEPRQSLRHNRYIIGAETVVVALVAAVAANQTGLADRAVHFAKSLNQPMEIPRGDDATTIKIGDRVAFTDKDGKSHQVRIDRLDDIAQAASDANSNMSYGEYMDLREMLGRERNAANYHIGTPFTVQKKYHLTDVDLAAHR